MDINEHENKLLKSLFIENASHPKNTISEGVMKHIDESSKVFEYRPIISKRNWMFISIGIAAIILLSFSFSSESTGFALPEAFYELGSGLKNLSLLFSSYTYAFQLPELSFTIKILMSLFIVIGSYFMVFYKWGYVFYHK